MFLSIYINAVITNANRSAADIFSAVEPLVVVGFAVGLFVVVGFPVLHLGVK